MSDHESILANLPDDWNEATIEDLGAVVSGGTPSREIASFWGGKIPWVTPGEVTTLKRKTLRLTNESITDEGLRQSGANLLPTGSLLVTTRASLGYCVINSIPVTTNQGFKSIVFRQSSNPDFYYHWARKISTELKRRASGTTFLEISSSDFKQIKLPVPPSAEQQKIAQILDTLDTQIQNTEALIAKLENIKKGLLHDLLTRGIDQNGQLRPTSEQAPELYKESALGLIPKEWLGTKLGTYISDHEGLIQTGPFGSQLHAEEYVSQGVPVVMPQDIRHISISRSNIAQITEKRARDLARHRLLEGDLVFSRRGDLSRCAYVQRDNEGWVCGTGCLLLRAPIGTIDTYWLSNLYKLHSIQSQVYGMAVGSTMVNLNSKILAQLEIGIPSYREQCLIATAISSIESRLQRETNSLRKLTAQKTGLMDDLLTGRVRVTPLLKDAV